MKLFQFVQKFYKNAGICLPHSNQPYNFNARNLFLLASFTMMCTASTAFFLFKAKLIREHADSFYISTTDLCGLINLLINMWKIPLILDFIEKCEGFIEKSLRTFLSINCFATKLS